MLRMKLQGGPSALGKKYVDTKFKVNVRPIISGHNDDDFACG